MPLFGLSKLIFLGSNEVVPAAACNKKKRKKERWMGLIDAGSMLVFKHQHSSVGEATLKL